MRGALISTLFLAGCTTTNDVMLAQAQANLEAQKANQALSAGLAASSTLNALTLALIVAMVCAIIFLTFYAFVWLPRQNKQATQLRMKEAAVRKRAPHQARQVTTDELLRLYLMTQITANRPELPQEAQRKSARYETDDDLWLDA